jgi:hypothetical protein
MLAPTLDLGLLNSLDPACALPGPRAAPHAGSGHAEGADAGIEAPLMVPPTFL